jgi:8-oxo-dGTP pyrophosphatase MutT (NUDIX family)
MRCDQSLRNLIAENLGRFEPIRSREPGKRGAAVAITVADEAFGADLPGLPQHDTWQDRAALILTRRSSGLRNHPGQWALPGGRIDAGETAERAALRELAEEVNLELGTADVIGTLDDFVTRSGFVITPVVLWAGAGRDLRFNPSEVASIHRIPVAEFLREDAPRLDRLSETRSGSETGSESEHPVLRMPVGDTWIAAPTAALIYQFREVCMHGRATRVAHYEQPLFAWR